MRNCRRRGQPDSGRRGPLQAATPSATGGRRDSTGYRQRRGRGGAELKPAPMIDSLSIPVVKSEMKRSNLQELESSSTCLQEGNDKEKASWRCFSFLCKHRKISRAHLHLLC